MAALLLVGSGAKADVVETFDLSGSFQFPARTFMGAIDFDFSNDGWTAKSADVTVDGLPAYDQSPALRFAISGSPAVVDVFDSTGDVLTLMFAVSPSGTLTTFKGGMIAGGEASFGNQTGVQGVLLYPTGSLTLGAVASDPVPAASVPEASTWAMMLLGFVGLGLGAAARHARRRAAIAMARRFGAEAPIRDGCLRG